MRKKKIILLCLIIILFLSVSKMDKKIRFNMGLMDYYRHSRDLTIREKVLVKNNQILVGVYELPPLSYVNKFNNHNAGILIDYLSQIAIETGSEIHVKAKDLIGLNNLKTDSKLDAAIVEVSNYKEPMESVLLTQPLCSSNIITIVDKNTGYKKLEDLKGGSLVSLKKDKIHEEVSLFNDNNLGIDILVVDNIYQAFALLNTGIVDGFIGNDMELYHYINVTNSGSRYSNLSESFNKKYIVMAVKDPDLLNILNKGILQIKKKNLIAQTQYKWLGDQDNLTTDLKYIGKVYKIISFISILIIFFSSWNYLISKKVSLRTRELLESREELRLIIDSMKIGIMVLAKDHTILECNDSLSNIVNINKDKIIGTKYDDNFKLSEFVNKRNLNTVLNIDDKYYYVSKQKISDSKCMVLIEDYTEKYFIQKRERQQSKMVTVGKLSAGLAHEIRNPLGLIKSYSYVLKMTKEENSYNKALEVINTSVDRINNLIENLLSFSKLSNNQQELVNINNLLKEIKLTYLKELQKNNIKIDIKYLNSSLEKLKINDEILRITINNLLENSIHSFSDRISYENFIKIKLKARDKTLVIIIEDNGCGMDEEKIENIYEPFYSTKDKGTGLGLYIVSTEVFNIGGKIFLESKENVGSKFEVHLPIME